MKVTRSRRKARVRWADQRGAAPGCRLLLLAVSVMMLEKPEKKESTDMKTTLAVFSRQQWGVVCSLAGCLMSQQHASVSQGRICSDYFACCHTEIEVAD